MNFLTALKNCETHKTPWHYITLQNPLTDEQIVEIKNANIVTNQKSNDGTRSGCNTETLDKDKKFREYVTKDNSYKYPHLTKLVKDLQSFSVRKTIYDRLSLPKQNVISKNFDGCYVRLEILSDPKGFWLKPHIDIKEKLISSCLFINDTNENINLGTDLYNNKLKLVSTIPFKHNSGFIFSDHITKNKWHGFEKGKTVKKERKGVQLNYVTFKTDWKVV